MSHKKESQIKAVNVNRRKKKSLGNILKVEIDLDFWPLHYKNKKFMSYQLFSYLNDSSISKFLHQFIRLKEWGAENEVAKCLTKYLIFGNF